MQVSDLRVGQKARILAFLKGDGVYRRKLIALGLLPGTTFTLSRMAPLGDPIEIQIRGYALSLRKHEANILLIEEAS
jgi:ferrous iron transport protein A